MSQALVDTPVKLEKEESTPVVAEGRVVGSLDDAEALSAASASASSSSAAGSSSASSSGAIVPPLTRLETIRLQFKPTDVIQLSSVDHQTFTVLAHDALISNLVLNTLEEDAKAITVPFTFKLATFNILEFVVQYMKYHKGVDPAIIPHPLRSKVMVEVCKDPWDATFIDNVEAIGQNELFHLFQVANYLDIKSLLHLAGAKIATQVKGQPLEQIKDILCKGPAAVKKEQAQRSAAAAAAGSGAPSATSASAASSLTSSSTSATAASSPGLRASASAAATAASNSDAESAMSE